MEASFFTFAVGHKFAPGHIRYRAVKNNLRYTSHFKNKPTATKCDSSHIKCHFQRLFPPSFARQGEFM